MVHTGGGMVRNSRQEHEEIYEAARRRDAAAAVSALRRHMGKTVELLRAGMAEGSANLVASGSS